MAGIDDLKDWLAKLYDQQTGQQETNGFEYLQSNGSSNATPNANTVAQETGTGSSGTGATGNTGSATGSGGSNILGDVTGVSSGVGMVNQFGNIGKGKPSAAVLADQGAIRDTQDAMSDLNHQISAQSEVAKTAADNYMIASNASTTMTNAIKQQPVLQQAIDIRTQQLDAQTEVLKGDFREMTDGAENFDPTNADQMARLKQLYPQDYQNYQVTQQNLGQVQLQLQNNATTFSAAQQAYDDATGQAGFSNIVDGDLAGDSVIHGADPVALANLKSLADDSKQQLDDMTGSMASDQSELNSLNNNLASDLSAKTGMFANIDPHTAMGLGAAAGAGALAFSGIDSAYEDPSGGNIAKAVLGTGGMMASLAMTSAGLAVQGMVSGLLALMHLSGAAMAVMAMNPVVFAAIVVAVVVIAALLTAILGHHPNAAETQNIAMNQTLDSTPVTVWDTSILSMTSGLAAMAALGLSSGPNGLVDQYMLNVPVTKIVTQLNAAGLQSSSGKAVTESVAGGVSGTFVDPSDPTHIITITDSGNGTANIAVNSTTNGIKVAMPTRADGAYIPLYLSPNQYNPDAGKFLNNQTQVLRQIAATNDPVQAQKLMQQLGSADKQ